jgi:hypothetical protein
MKTPRRAILCLAVLASLFAGRVCRAEGTGVGLGFGVEPLGFAGGAGGLLVAGRNTAPASFYLPIQLSPRLRIEPSGGYFHVSRGKASTSPGGSSAYSFSASVGGVGGLFYLVPTAPAGLYVGGRLTLAIYSGYFLDQSLPVTSRKTVLEAALFVAPVVGGEYAFSRRFAAGLEMQLPIALLGDRSIRTQANANTPNIGNIVSTNTVLFVRYFFL